MHLRPEEDSDSEFLDYINVDGDAFRVTHPMIDVKYVNYLEKFLLVIHIRGEKFFNYFLNRIHGNLIQVYGIGLSAKEAIKGHVMDRVTTN